MGGGVSTLDPNIAQLRLESAKPASVVDLPNDAAVLKAELGRVRSQLKAAFTASQVGGGYQTASPNPLILPAIGSVASAPVSTWGQTPRTIIADKVYNSFFDQFQTFKECFAALDADGGGSISEEEFRGAIERSGMVLNDAEFRILMTKLDVDQSGSLDYAEFMRFIEGSEDGFWAQGLNNEGEKQQLNDIASALRNQISRKYNSLRKAFMAVDKDRTGSIDTGELFRILEGGNYSFSEADVNQFVAAFRHEGTGGFQYAEFCIMLEGRQPFEVPLPSQEY